MKLDEHLKRALETGHARYRLTSVARGVEIASGLLSEVKADELETLAREDAVPLSREGLHDYALVVESEDGAKRSRVAVRVHGGKLPESEHTVDVDRVATSGAVIGHLVKLLVAKDAAIMQMVAKVLDRDMADTKEIGRLRRAVASNGEVELVKMKLEAEQKAEAEDRAQRRGLIEQFVGLLGPVVLKSLPGGAATALDKFRASLKPDQAEALCAILGAARFSKVMTIADPAAMAEFLLTEVDRETMARVMPVLSEEQQGILRAALIAEMKRREGVESAAKAAAANGAPS
jgi:hypothetical protein